MAKESAAKSVLPASANEASHSVPSYLPQPGEKVRILIIINDPKFFDPMMPMLLQHGLDVRFARNIVAAVGQLSVFKPHVVMLSWNIARYNVKDLYKVMCDRLNAMILVFSEITNPTIVMRLNNSGIPQTLFPPLSADGIFTRVQGLLKKHSQDEPKPGDLGCDLVAASAVQYNLVWERIYSPKRGADLDGIYLWKGTCKDSGQIFLYEGAKCPIFNLQNKAWDTGDEKGVFIEAREEGQAFVNALDPLVAVAAPPEGTIAAADKAVPGLSASMHIIEKCLRTSLRTFSHPVNDPPVEFPPIRNVCGVIFRSRQFQGYLLSSNNVDCFDPDLLHKISKDIVSQMNRFGEQIHQDAEPMLMIFTPEVLKRILTEMPTFHVQFKYQEHHAACTFISGAELPKIGEMTSVNYVGIPVSSLVPDVSINFDLHLNLPSNGKFMLYRKKNTVLTQANIDKFNAFDCKSVYVVKDEMDLVRAYQSKIELASRAGAKKP